MFIFDQGEFCSIFKKEHVRVYNGKTQFEYLPLDNFTQSHSSAKPDVFLCWSFRELFFSSQGKFSKCYSHSHLFFNTHRTPYFGMELYVVFISCDSVFLQHKCQYFCLWPWKRIQQFNENTVPYSFECNLPHQYIKDQ